MPKPVAIYPLNGVIRGKNISPRLLAPGKLGNVVPAPGPDGLPIGSYKFKGLSDSFIKFPNNGNLDTRNSITISAWVYPESAGPIFHFLPRSWGVHLWLTDSKTLFARFVPRSKRPVR